MSRRRRALSDEERALWEAVKKTAKPLAPEPPPMPVPAPTPPRPAEAGTPSPPDKSGTPGKKPSAARPAPPSAPAGPPPLDRRTRSRLSRGLLDVDARLDLHGLTQSSAHIRLRRFLEEAQAADHRLVLVITGKGEPEIRADFTAPVRGVLRRAVPAWLESAEFRPLVAGHDEAGRRHGGEGAIYVRIRRRR